jgi:hypothetical protein
VTLPSSLIHSEELASRFAEAVWYDQSIDDVLNSIKETSEEVRVKIRTTNTGLEAANPEGTLELTRIWKEVDTVVGPGNSVLHIILTRYHMMSKKVERMNTLLRRGFRTRSKHTLDIIIKNMEHEIKTLSTFKSDITKAMMQDASEIKKKLRAEMGEEAFHRLATLSSDEVKQECNRALNELERAFQNQLKAVPKGVDTRPGITLLKAGAEANITKLKSTKEHGERAVMAARIRRLEEFNKDFQKMGSEFGNRLKQQMFGALPAIEEIEDSAIFFMEALGVIASARPEGARLLRRYAKSPHSLGEQQLKKISGYLSQLRGLLPEEIATRMKFLDSIFYKNAHDLLEDFPRSLRGQMSVEMVEGPLWMVETGRQFGDGCMLLTGPNGQSAIVGLGEFKAGFDKDLLKQLFVTSDERTVNATVTFIGKDGKEQLRTLTREFTFPDAKPVAMTKPPIYVYGRPTREGIDMSIDTEAQFKRMVNEQMESGRELWKICLPFDTGQNNHFVEVCVKEGVKALIKVKKDWGLLK